MARELTVDELNLLRSDSQWSRLYLAIFKPNTIYTARLNGVPASNDEVYQITFDGGSGTLADVKPGMTLYVGSSAGAYDLGMVRIRKAPVAGTFYIGLTSEIQWVDDCYLTVVDEFDLWAKHPVSTSGVLTMDVDVSYGDQHEDFNPVPVLGPHAVVWLDDVTVDVDFDASDSWVFDSTISDYAWTAPGASSSSGMTTDTPTITYNAAGIYRVYCTVTAANGKTTTGVRHVFVYDRDENQPATVFQLAQCFADYETGGWMFDMTMEAEASLSELRERSLVVLFAEDYYGETKQSIGPVENRENIVCVGRVVGESIRWDREAGLVHFTVQGPHHWLNKIMAFPVELAFNNSPSAWSDMPLMTVDRVHFHLLYWHSTVIETMDYYPTNNELYTQDGRTIASTLWGQIQDIAAAKLMASAGVDRFSRLIVEIDPQMVAEVDRDWPEVMELTAQDWVESIEFQRQVVHDISLVSLVSQYVSEEGAVAAYYSLSPGHVPERYGEIEIHDRLLSASQEDSNSKAGLLLGWRKNEITDLRVVFAQNNRMIDLWPRQVCSLTVGAENTPREFSFEGNLIPRRMALYFNGDSGYMNPEINFEAEISEVDSIDGDVPGSEDIDTTEFPPIPSFPPLPDFPLILPSDVIAEGGEGSKRVILHDPTYGLVYTADFDASSPTWIQINSGLTTDQYQSIDRIVTTRSGAIYVTNTGLGTDAFIAWAPGPGQLFTVLEDSDSILEKCAGTQAAVHCIGRDRSHPDRVAYIIGSSGGTSIIYVGGGTSFAEGAVLPIAKGFQRFSSISYSKNSGTWILTAKSDDFLSPEKWFKISGTGASLISENDYDNSSQRCQLHIRAGYSDVLYAYDNPGGNAIFIRSIDNMATYTADLLTSPELSGLIEQYDTIDCDATGQFLMGNWDTGSKGKSSTYGSSWVGMSSLPFIGLWHFAWLGGEGIHSVWGAAGGTSIRRSTDFGVTWENSEGNAIADFPLSDWDYIVSLDELYA